jgi:hypothetical protein
MLSVVVSTLLCIATCGVLFAGGYLLATMREMQERNIGLWRWQLGRKIGEVPKTAYIPAEVLTCSQPMIRFAIPFLVLGLVIMGIGFVTNYVVAMLGSVLLLTSCIVWLVTKSVYSKAAEKGTDNVSLKRGRKTCKDAMEHLQGKLEKAEPASDYAGYLRWWLAQYGMDIVETDWADVHHVHGDTMKQADAEFAWVADKGPAELREAAALKQRELRRLVGKIKKSAHKASKKEKAREDEIRVHIQEEAWPT